MLDLLFGFLPEAIEWVVKIGVLVLGTLIVAILLLRRFSRRRALVVQTWGDPHDSYPISGREVADALRVQLRAIWRTHAAKRSDEAGEATSLGDPTRESENLGARAMSLLAENSPFGFLVGLSSKLWPALAVEGEIVSGEGRRKFCGARLKKGRRYYHAWLLPIPEGKGAVDELVEELAYRIVLDSARGRALEETKGAGTDRWRAFRSLTEAMQLWAEDGFKHSDEDRVEAVDHKLAEAIDHDPEYALAHFNRGILWLRTIRDAGTNARARDHFLEAHRLAREQARNESLTTVHVDRRVEGLAALGVARTYSQDRHRFGRVDGETVRKAREAAGEAVRCLPGDPDALYARAFAFHCTETLEDIEAAIPVYREIIGKRPGEHPGAHNNLGYIYMVGGEHLREAGFEEKARKYWARAEKEMKLTLKHSDPRSRTIEFAHANLGNLYRLQGRYEEAESHYLQALEPDPGSSRYTNGLNEYARLLLEVGRREEGLEFHRLAMATTEDPGQREKLREDLASFLGEGNAPFLREDSAETP